MLFSQIQESNEVYFFSILKYNEEDRASAIENHKGELHHLNFISMFESKSESLEWLMAAQKFGPIITFQDECAENCIKFTIDFMLHENCDDPLKHVLYIAKNMKWNNYMKRCSVLKAIEKIELFLVRFYTIPDKKGYWARTANCLRAVLVASVHENLIEYNQQVVSFRTHCDWEKIIKLTDMLCLALYQHEVYMIEEDIIVESQSVMVQSGLVSLCLLNSTTLYPEDDEFDSYFDLASYVWEAVKET